MNEIIKRKKVKEDPLELHETNFKEFQPLCQCCCLPNKSLHPVHLSFSLSLHKIFDDYIYAKVGVDIEKLLEIIEFSTPFHDCFLPTECNNYI